MIIKNTENKTVEDCTKLKIKTTKPGLTAEKQKQNVKIFKIQHC